MKLACIYYNNIKFNKHTKHKVHIKYNAYVKQFLKKEGTCIWSFNMLEIAAKAFRNLVLSTKKQTK